MSAIREEIRSILREELAALTGPMHQITTETVRMSSSADLMRFAQDILTRAACPNFVAKIASGQIQFTLAQILPTTSSNSIVNSPAKQRGALIDKKLVTERDILELNATAKTLRLPKRTRITPLASDEAHRRGIRIERIEE
mgnify:CR=1 FL=1|jgi:hypothetical protein